MVATFLNLQEGDPAVEKFLVTFPYPYMNGRLHLGHAFTISKVSVPLIAMVALMPLVPVLSGRVHSGVSATEGEEMSVSFCISLHWDAHQGNLAGVVCLYVLL